MKMIIFGAAGDVGQRFVGEALLRGHEVTVFIRKPDQAEIWGDKVQVVIGDLDDTENLISIVKEHDFILSALRPAEGKEDLLVPLTSKVMSIAGEAGLPILITGGAASLKIPNTDHTVLTAPDFLPDSVRPIATACQDQYDMCLGVVDVNWTYQAPSAMLIPAERTGKYRIETDQLVTDGNGNSQISMEDFAVAALDEVENRRFIRQRFTAGY
ncbi:NAD(P)-dependent oxidoreductase [Curvivirga aplysinae]|uniref:NAD(P)-dependent oxidoreductase n=1 Tax=Curvivirga aplysinae TaxID=2529852 RepID=UPI0012BC9AC9|nr:NAD(P)H-binding protein [Curvivirga aplysinae]MTI09266.1 NADH-flavin reductase [Curvivirga aplysinae]